MSTEIVVPFALDKYGNVATTSDPAAQAMQHVTVLVDTEPGERVMQPNYGVPLKEYIFEPDPTTVTKQISQDVKTQMAIWEPTIVVLNVTPHSSDSFGVANVEVDFELNPNSSPDVFTATVEVGGTVIEATSQ
jgi:hypothetical protein